MRTLTSAKARNHFGQLLETAQNEAVSITRHGRPTAVLVSVKDMEELLDARRRRGRAVAELEEWLRAAAAKAQACSAALTDDEVNRLVHKAR